MAPFCTTLHSRVCRNFIYLCVVECVCIQRVSGREREEEGGFEVIYRYCNIYNKLGRLLDYFLYSIFTLSLQFNRFLPLLDLSKFGLELDFLAVLHNKT